jgi:hypothetical protein
MRGTIPPYPERHMAWYLMKQRHCPQTATRNQTETSSRRRLRHLRFSTLPDSKSGNKQSAQTGRHTKQNKNRHVEFRLTGQNEHKNTSSVTLQTDRLTVNAECNSVIPLHWLPRSEATIFQPNVIMCLAVTIRRLQFKHQDFAPASTAA